MRILMTTIAALMVATSASAQDQPDLRGTWAGTTEAVVLDTDDYYETGNVAPEFMTVPVEVVIDQQEGRRFAGTITADRWNKPFVGVLAANDRILWAEPGGIVDARLIDADTLDYCYVRPAEFRQLASCAELKRQN
jgi:hypothetical protein